MRKGNHESEGHKDGTKKIATKTHKTATLTKHTKKITPR